MSRQINQPINQVRLTNVAVVRHVAHGKRFEIACYRNKVLDYRSGLEQDLDEVLQTSRIFTNVSKGEFAPAQDLYKVFKTTNNQDICRIILKQGQSLQVSDLERQHQLENVSLQIATWVARNCVATGTTRPFTVSQIQQALTTYPIQPNKPLKKQYLEAVKYLKTVLPIERAQMELSLQYPVTADDDDQTTVLQQGLQELSITPIQTTHNDTTSTVVLQVDPSLYRPLNELAKKVNGRLEILQQVVMEMTEDVDLEKEVERKARQQQQQVSWDQSKGNDELFDQNDEEAVELVEKLQSVRLQAAGGTYEPSPRVAKPSQKVSTAADSDHDSTSDNRRHNVDSDDDDLLLPQPSRRKNQRKAQKKKNKKAKKERQQQQQLQNEAQEEEEETDKQEEIVPPAPSTTPKEEPGHKSCNTCGGSFANAADYRAHFRSDWHRFNQKLKLKNIPPVSEEEFQLCDVDSFFATAD